MKPQLLEILGDKPLLMESAAARRVLGVVHALGAPRAEDFERWKASRSDRRPYEVDMGGTAVIPIRGMILKAIPPWLEYWGEYLGWDFCSTEATRNAVAQAIEDQAVSSIRLEIDSPGGTVDGVQALADDLFAARQLKPMSAEIDGMMASAALWLGCQAKEIHAGPTSEIGSIGVFTVLVDSSGMAEELGIKVHVISNAPGKGHAGGAPIPPEQLANAQKLVDDFTKLFVAAVARGREMDVDAVAQLATGEVWLGAAAKKHGLVDKVGPDRKAIKQTGRKADSQEMTMTKEEQDRLAKAEANAAAEKARADEATAEAEKQKARADAAEALVAASHVKQREAVVDQNADRVPPSAREAVLKFGATFGSDIDAFASYVKALPRVLRDEPQGAAPEGDADGATPNDPVAALTPEEMKLCKLHGKDPKAFLAHKRDLAARQAAEAQVH